MEKTPQNLLNEKFLQLITELTDTIVNTSKSRDILLAIQKLHTKRIDSLENKIDILMIDRHEPEGKN